ncbi:MAG: hypothetical protein AAGB22_00425 [Bacteroidota bacterium]
MAEAFPIYRKYTNNKSYFKIHSPEAFDELQLLGKRCTVHHFEAKIHPDRMYIQDMIANTQGNWEAITAAEYEAVLERC